MANRKYMSFWVVILCVAPLILCSSCSKSNPDAKNNSGSFKNQVNNLIETASKRLSKNKTQKQIYDAEQASRALLNMDNEKVTAFLLKSIPTERDSNKKVIMISTLSGMVDETKQKNISNVLSDVIKKDKNINVQIPAVLALANIKTKESFSILSDIIKNNYQKQLVYVAILAIGDHYNKDAIPLLKEKIETNDISIKEAAEYSLEKISNENFIPKEVPYPKTLLDKQKNKDALEYLQKRVRSRLNEAKSGSK